MKPKHITVERTNVDFALHGLLRELSCLLENKTLLMKEDKPFLKECRQLLNQLVPNNTL